MTEVILIEGRHVRLIELESNHHVHHFFTLVSEVNRREGVHTREQGSFLAVVNTRNNLVYVKGHVRGLSNVPDTEYSRRNVKATTSEFWKMGF